jgi:SAM-dependent methyltransferase
MSSGNLNAIAAIQELYKSGSETRKQFGDSLPAATEYYSSLVEFVTRVVSPTNGSTRRRLLDVGCGCGWSSFCFARAGYRTSGVDLNASVFEPPRNAELSLTEGSALSLPFQDESFDVVVTYQCLEHIPEPENALREMIRTCKPGGIICVVGPNLVSPFLPLKDIGKDLLRGHITRRRTPGMPRHPYGNTTVERFRAFFFVSGLLMKKLLDPDPGFDMRVPDTNPPFDADNDACYLCNPTDLVKFFRGCRFRILQNGKHGRPPISQIFAGGTWIAVQKAG